LRGGLGRDRLNGYGSATDVDTLIGWRDSDTFVLGNSQKAYYQGDGYAIIADWQQWDRIELYGKIDDYSIETTQIIMGNSAIDTQIFYKTDLIGIIQDSTQIDLANNFIFV
jgi:serralysin